jgi:DNA adenine methylase
MTTRLVAPFPYFGGKSTVASEVWARFGEVRNYVEPFFGSGAVLLGRPAPFEGTETVNDINGFVCNFFRALKADPAGLAEATSNPVNENDLHAIHARLVGQRAEIVARLEGDPDWYDLKAAGRWCWGINTWIGSGWCSGKGPWQSVEREDGTRQLVHLGDAGVGVNRQRVHLGDAGRGVNRKRVHLGDAGMGDGPGAGDGSGGLLAWFFALADRLARVRVCCGDWTRVCGPTPTLKMGRTAVFLDPPYSAGANRDGDLYADDSTTVAHDVRAWALAHGDDRRLRIALCGYEGEHAMPDSWECLPWKAQGGYGSLSRKHDNPNARRERIWFSPSCLKPAKVTQVMLWDLLPEPAVVEPAASPAPPLSSPGVATEAPDPGPTLATARVAVADPPVKPGKRACKAKADGPDLDFRGVGFAPYQGKVET